MGAGNGRGTRQNRSTPDDGFERVFAVGPSEKRRRPSETGSSELPCDFGKEFRDRLNSPRADQTPDLAPQGREGDDVNQCQGAREERRSDSVRGFFNTLAP